jgi:hypothetical protein
MDLEGLQEWLQMEVALKHQKKKKNWVKWLDNRT